MMLGLELRKEFKESRLKGPAIEAVGPNQGRPVMGEKP